MKNKLLFLSVFVLSLSLSLNVKSQAPTLIQANLPCANDSVNYRVDHIQPAVGPWTAPISAVADSITCDRGIYKALKVIDDTAMMNLANIKGANQTWTVSTLYYNAFANPTIASDVYLTPNAYVPGHGNFPKANLYFESLVNDTATYNYQIINSSGYYSLGSYYMGKNVITITYPTPMPTVLFPVTYNTVNVPNTKYISNTNEAGGLGSYSSIIWETVNVDAYGTVNLVTGTPKKPVTTSYTNCLRVVTTSFDTVSAASLGEIFIETKIYAWYTTSTTSPAQYPEPLLSYSYARIRNNIDTTLWSYDPADLDWQDEFDFQYTTHFTVEGVTELTNSNDLISIFPNPSTGVFNISQNKPNNKAVLVEVYDILGSKIYGKEISGQNSQIDLSGISKGVYFVKIFSSTEPIVKKVIIR